MKKEQKLARIADERFTRDALALARKYQISVDEACSIILARNNPVVPSQPSRPGVTDASYYEVKPQQPANITNYHGPVTIKNDNRQNNRQDNRQWNRRKKGNTTTVTGEGYGYGWENPGRNVIMILTALTLMSCIALSATGSIKYGDGALTPTSAPIPTASEPRTVTPKPTPTKHAEIVDIRNVSMKSIARNQIN